jgi:trehalose 6-phosphate phosphatase
MCDAQGPAGDNVGRPAPPPLAPAGALFLDVDGTLLDIAPRPEQVRVSPGLPALLARLAGTRGDALALVSGRPLAQIDALFRPWHGAAAGLHGIERRRVGGTVEAAVPPDAAAALAALRPRLDRLARGLLVEDKGATLALHYRAAPERGAELRAAAEALCAAAGGALRLIHGKMVLEFQPAGVDKGAAIAAFLAEPPFRDRLPIFLGDDATDEDGFREVARRGGFGVRVGSPAPTAATHALPSVGAVLAWLGASG